MLEVGSFMNVTNHLNLGHKWDKLPGLEKESPIQPPLTWTSLAFNTTALQIQVMLDG